MVVSETAAGTNEKLAMPDIEVRQVIISHLQTKGVGRVGDPYRKPIQVYDFDGSLIAENDPYTKFSADDFWDFILFLNTRYPDDKINITKTDVADFIASIR